MKGVILDCDSLGPADLDLAPIINQPVEWTIYPTTEPDQTVGRITDADIVLTNKVVLGQTEILAAPRLKYIGVLATGTNVIDLTTAGAQGITVTNITGYGTDSVVQHCFALMLALMTRLPDYDQAATDGRWAQSPFFCLLDFPIQQLAGSTLGIVGYGQLGKGVANIARAFGMNVRVASLPQRHNHGASDRTPLDELLPQVDVLSLHCPLAPETRNLIGEQQLARMKPSAFLINCARGGIVDEAALARALRDGQLAGAGIDVLSEEPPRSPNPLLEPDIPNLIVTPHCAWGSRESRQKLVALAGENITAFLGGISPI
jgi:glycerate dehydrogenase